MIRRVLVTGGAGFIGSHVCDELLAHGYEVRVLDALAPQVHGPDRRRPAYLDREVELLVGDVRDRDRVRQALRGMEGVVHLAAAVGVGQSMYQVEDYTSVNNIGTAVLLEALIEKPVSRLLVASSMSVYGEGAYQDDAGGLHLTVAPRRLDQLQAGRWEPRSAAGRPLMPIPTPESKPAMPTSVYALSKYDQERMSLLVGEAYGIGTVALRFFNVYGPRQALSNPYTGVLAIFASRLLNGMPPMIFEDGLQQRDFVNVHDVAVACRLALESPRAAGNVFNVGSGQPITIEAIGRQMSELLERPELVPEISRKYRVGDIRHCVADIGLARKILKYQPAVRFEDGLRELSAWLEGQTAEDHTVEARAELMARGLVV